MVIKLQPLQLGVHQTVIHTENKLGGSCKIFQVCMSLQWTPVTKGITNKYFEIQKNMKCKNLHFVKKKKKKKLNKQKTFLFHPPTKTLLSNTIICPKEIK